MNPNEYEQIIHFIREEKYPEATQASRQTKCNYKRRLSSYFIGDSNRLFKVILTSLFS